MTAEEFTHYRERLLAILEDECHRVTELGELFEVTPLTCNAMQFLIPDLANIRPLRAIPDSNTAHIGYYRGKPVFVRLNTTDPDWL